MVTRETIEDFAKEVADGLIGEGIVIAYPGMPTEEAISCAIDQGINMAMSGDHTLLYNGYIPLELLSIILERLL